MTIKKDEYLKKAQDLFDKSSEETKELFKYFIASLKDNNYLVPDYFYLDRDPKMFLDNYKDVIWLLKHASIESLKVSINICHSRKHNFWGTKCPVLKFSTLKKAYNGLLSSGVLNKCLGNSLISTEDSKVEYGKKIHKF